MGESPELRRAHAAVRQALADGRLREEACEVCGDINADAHHDDYAKPLEVRWLCRQHHGAHHAENGPGANDGRAARQPQAPRAERFQICCTPDEFEEWTGIAVGLGQSLSAWARAAIHREARREKRDRG